MNIESTSLKAQGPRFTEEKPGGSSSPRASSVERRTHEFAVGGFTLIELLTTVAIIIILAGMVVGISSYANRNAVESRIRAEIKAMETALEAYKADYGAYPPLDQDAFTPGAPLPMDKFQIETNFTPNVTVGRSNGWLNTHFIYRALSGINTPKAYMTFAPKQLAVKTNANLAACTIILDPTGKPYGYNPYTPAANPQTFDLWSAGVDSKSSYPNLSSTNDDLGNWQR
ncbi:MAG: hypothetical protein IT578_07595 [Verrucomicrobiae bacterium]|nr:hypothetical protein [Verrucomicrobiae bacterium]